MSESLDILHTYITTHQPKRTVYHGGISEEERVKFEHDLAQSLDSINSESIEYFREWISPNGVISASKRKPPAHGAADNESTQQVQPPLELSYESPILSNEPLMHAHTLHSDDMALEMEYSESSPDDMVLDSNHATVVAAIVPPLEQPLELSHNAPLELEYV